MGIKCRTVYYFGHGCQAIYRSAFGPQILVEASKTPYFCEYIPYALTSPICMRKQLLACMTLQIGLSLIEYVHRLKINKSGC